MGGVVERRLRLAGAKVDVLPATTAQQMQVWCRQAVESACHSARLGEWHAVVAVGGDGTVHTVLQAVGTSGVPVGVVAAGSGDDAARAWGLPRARPDDAATVLLTGRTTTVDLGVSEDVDGSTTFFATVLAAGFDSRVSERSLRLQAVPTALRYVVAIAAELREFRPLHYRLNLDGEAWQTEGMLVAVANGPSYGGGMAVCPDADPRDGLLDVLVLRPLPTLDFLRVFPRVYRGTHLDHVAVSVRRARHVHVQAEHVVAFADGERVGPLPQSVTVVPGGLTIVGP